MEIKVKEILGEDIIIEDAILLREIIRKNINSGVSLDFEGFKRIPTTFFNMLFAIKGIFFTSKPENNGKDGIEGQACGGA